MDAFVLLINDGFRVRLVWVAFFSIPEASADQLQAAVDSLEVYGEHCIAAVLTCKYAETGAVPDAKSYSSYAWCRVDQLAFLTRRAPAGEFWACQMSDEVLLLPLFMASRRPH